MSRKSKPRCQYEDICSQERPIKQGSEWQGAVIHLVSVVVILFSNETTGLFLAVFTFTLPALWDLSNEPISGGSNRKWPNYLGRAISLFWSVMGFISFLPDTLTLKTTVGDKRTIVIQGKSILMNGLTLELPIAVLYISLIILFAILVWGSFSTKTTKTTKTKMESKKSEPTFDFS